MRVSPDDFDQHYRAAEDGDPWAFRTSAYEQRRYDLTVGCLDRPRYGRAFEPGCAVGELTARLAERCDELIAIDPSVTALDVARRRLDGRSGVMLHLGAVPEAWPTGAFDLIVLSEIGYYFDRDDLADLVRRSVSSLAARGQLLAVHWRGHSDDHLLHGDEVHEVVRATVGTNGDLVLVDPGFLCERWDLP